MAEQVEIRHELIINAPQRKVFDFVSDYRNDPQWRTEVDRFEFAGELAQGVLVTEYSTFEGGAKLITPTVITERIVPTRSVAETPAGFSGGHLLSVRTLEPVSPQVTKFIYELAVDRDMLKPIMPELPPTPALVAWYGGVVTGYLETLKTILERD